LAKLLQNPGYKIAAFWYPGSGFGCLAAKLTANAEAFIKQRHDHCSM